MADVEQTEDIDPEDVEGLTEVEPDLEPDDLEAAEEPDLDADAFDPDAADDHVEEVEEDIAVPVATPAKAKAGKGPAKRQAAGDDDEEEDDDEEDDDVEADLDAILKDRIAAPPDDDEEEEEVAPVEADDRSEGAGKIQPRKPGEFVCQSCFLVKHPSQLADPDNMLCADCV